MAPSLQPQNIDSFNWYYEYPDHIELIHEVRTSEGSWLKTEHIRIPWAMIRKSLARKDHKRLPKEQEGWAEGMES